MSEITVKKLAETVGAPVARLLTQMQEAGLPHSDIDEIVSDEQKQVLLTHLKRSHGEVPEGSEPKKITLKRKTLSTLKAGGSTRGKGVNVEVRKKRTYVKRAPAKVETEPETEEQIEARKIAEEAAAIVRVEDAARAAAEHEARQAVQASAEAEVLAQVEEQTKVAMLAVAAAAKAKAKTEVTPTASPAAKKSSGPKRLHEAPKRDDKAGDKKRGKGKGGRDRDGGDGRARRDVKGRRTGRVSLADDGGRSRGRRLRRKPEAMEHAFAKPTEDVVIDVNVPEFISVGELAQRMAVKATEVIKVLMGMGEMATINQTLEQEVAVLVVEEMGHNVKLFKDDAIETQLAEAIAVAHEGDTVSRAPIVTVMGHVDHGKTSLLDYIRKAKVADGEAGAITQHIGAYHAHTEQGMITFLDTPGHAAFTNMRSRGAKCTDVVILVVAADDGVMPQTEEAVQHAQAAGVPLVVAVNKIDKEAADPDRVKNELSAKGVVPDDWGGDTQFVHVSAHTGEGIDALLEAVHLQAELLELRAVNAGPATGVVVESRIDKGRGTVATLLVQQGQLNQGDMLLAGTQFGRVRAMVDEAGKKISVAGPSIPVEILGLDGAPEAGDEFQMVPNERKAREIAEFRAEKINQSRIAKQHAAKLENMFGAMASAERKILNIVLKTDVRGSLEALSGALQEIGNEEVQVNIVGSGVGGIAETDVSLAATTSAVIFGFNVRADGPAKRLIEAENVDLRYYSVIYDIIDDVKQALSGMLSPELRENIVGTAEVRDVFSSPKFGQIAGCMVIEGTVYRNKKIRVLRADVVIYEGELESLRRFKDDASEVRNGMECGIGVKDYTDVQAGDKIEVFDVKEVARAL